MKTVKMEHIMIRHLDENLTVLGREFPHLYRWRDESPAFLFTIDIFS